MERMNYINEDKKIRHLEESIRELENEEKKADLEQLKEWKRSLLLEWKMIQDIDEWNSLVEERNDLLEENKKLNEFKEKREESMFYFKAQMERAEPKTAREAEDLQKAKELFEGIYRGELYYLEQENKKLKWDLDKYKKYYDRDKEELMESCYSLAKENEKLNEKVRFLEECLDRKEKVNKSLREELSAYDREYFDEDKKAEHIFMEEDTLQELRDLGEI